MKKFILPFSSAFLLLLQSCVPEPIPIDLESAESLPVVWSQSLPATGVVVYLAKSFTALSYQEGDSTNTADLLNQMLVNNGRVIIRYDDLSDTLFQVSAGVYASLNLPIVPGEVYYLNATDLQSGKQVNAQTTAYEVVEIDSVGYERLDSNKVKLHVFFDDPNGQNFYALHFYSRYTNVLDVDDPLAADNTVVTKLLTDLEFESEQAVFEVELDELDGDSVYVSLNNIGADYFDYLGQRQRGGNLYNQLVQEPINYISNINGGFGMFTLHQPSIRMIVLNE
jgi:Domain of unknown function (DUF4249)